MATCIHSHTQIRIPCWDHCSVSEWLWVVYSKHLGKVGQCHFSNKGQYTVVHANIDKTHERGEKKTPSFHFHYLGVECSFWPGKVRNNQKHVYLALKVGRVLFKQHSLRSIKASTNVFREAFLVRSKEPYYHNNTKYIGIFLSFSLIDENFALLWRSLHICISSLRSSQSLWCLWWLKTSNLYFCDIKTCHEMHRVQNKYFLVDSDSSF